MVYPDTQVGRVSQHVLGLSEAQATALDGNGWLNLSDFEGFSTEDLTAWITQSGRITATRGGCVFPMLRARRICALAHWVNQKQLRGVPFAEGDFTAAEMRQAVIDYPIYDMQLKADDTVDKPEQFVYEKWEDWQETVITYLKGKKSVTKTIPLYYVIRPPDYPAAPTPEEQIIFNADHTGVAFTADNKAVHQLLTELTTGTDADHWIKQHKRRQDGRQAWLDLCEHYDGPAEGDKRVTVARSNIKLVHYKNETSFSFEKYSTRLKKSFSTLEQYGQPKSEREKVEILLDQINTSDQKLITVIGICRDRHANTFEEACTYLSQQVAIIYPQHQPNAFGKRGKGGKRPTVRNIHSVKIGKNGKVTCNGVDLTDTTRYLSQKEFSKIGKEGRDYLAKCPKRKAHKEAQKSNKKGKADTDVESQRHIAAIVNGVINATRNETESVAGSSLPSQVGGRPQHGPHARNTSAVGAAAASQRRNVRYDHEGNVLEE